MKIHGAAQSPFVRKVRIVLEEKGLPYEIENVVPRVCIRSARCPCSATATWWCPTRR